jgi:Fe2+ or Zn2+ uptake regulation protein
MKSPAELAARFREEGLKLTPQRLAVFQALYGTTEHPTAETVHQTVARDMPMVSLRTVYQTLNDLRAMGEIGQLDLGTGSSRFDPMTEPHHHLVCDRCGRVADLMVDFPDIAVPSDAGGGFAVDRTDITFRGLCATCAADPVANPTNQPTKE